MLDARAPIGVMDAGVGGFTTVRELQRLLPGEDIIYLGDGKNNPYGNRSKEEILCLTRQCLDFLHARGVKTVAVACNTISTLIEEYQADYGFRIFSIVRSGRDDVLRMGLREVGVLSTVFTAKTAAYAKEIRAKDPTVQVYAQGCPNLARLIESGAFDRGQIDEELRSTLGVLLAEQPQLNALVLGCTHFPLVDENIRRLYPALTTVIDPAATQAHDIGEYLAAEGALNPAAEGSLQVYTTAACENYRKMVERLGLKRVACVENIPPFTLE